MTNETYDDEFENNDEFEEDEPLFSKTSVILFSIVSLTMGIFSLTIFKFIDKNILDIIYLNDYNKQLFWLIFFKGTIVFLTIFIIGLIYYRLYHYSYESLSSYLGFGKPNWGFLLLWTMIFIGIHQFEWASQTRAIHLRLSENILTYGLWATLISTVIIAPICEEIICRGFLWRATLDAFQSERMALIISSAVFAFSHYNLNLNSVIFYFISSFIFVSARTTGGTLAFAIFLHFLHNFALVLETLVLLSP